MFKKIIPFISLLFTLMIVLLYLTSDKDLKIQKLTTEIELEHKNQIDSSILDFQNETELIFNLIINKKDILSIQYKALNSRDEKQRTYYRNQLYTKLTPLYQQLRLHGIKQLHFHFPDTTSFLRFHKPKKFGDNLKDIRYSLVVTNTKLIKTSGFEEGRIFNGYRYVYPLFFNNTHIGSVETSIGFNAINDRLKAIYNTYNYMILHKSVVDGKVFNGQKKNYELSNLSKEYYHEANTFVNYKNEFTDKTISLSIFNSINNKLSKTVSSKTLSKNSNFVKFVKIHEHFYAVSFHSIKNIKNKSIGYVISYAKSNKYQSIIKDYYTKIIFTTILVLLIFLFIYKMIRSKEKLESLSKVANEQKNKALLASKSKSEFLANMSHEIRTPLNAILGFVEILQKENKGRASLKFINIIYESSHTLLEIIEDILDFSKIESGKLEIDNIDFDTISEMKIITHLFEAKCSQKDISLSLILDDNIPKSIHSDPLRIKQVISNLLSNAIKFTENNKKITVKISYLDKQLHVSVIDQGIGIAADKQSYIFEAFNQEDSSTTRNYGGTGLGLSISSELVKLMGGKLQLKSELGVGSEFYFSIPCEVGKELETLNTDEDEEIVLEGIILLVEDNKTNQQLMQIILDDMGLDCEIANDGLEAIEKFKTNSYDAILMDENMPNMGGIEATSKILELEKTQKIPHTPIIALTANALKGDKEKFINAGMDAYISKPVDVQALTKTLKKLL